MPEPIEISAGCCPWCGGSKTITRGHVTLSHPPQDCCIPRAIWNLSWLVQYKHDYADDIRNITQRLRYLLAEESDPQAALQAALEQAKRQAAQHEGHGNISAVVSAMAAQIRGAR